MMQMIKAELADTFHGVMDFVHRYVLEMIILGFMSLGVCWAIGYFANAIWGMHFELQSAWGGFQAISGAGVLAAVKYCMDSWKNSPQGEAPVTHYAQQVREIVDQYLSSKPKQADDKAVKETKGIDEK